MKATNFETAIINKLLRLIKKHQVYLTKPENLPQLAKLGYMYNTLWYGGRVCWGWDGVLVENFLKEHKTEWERNQLNYISEDVGTTRPVYKKPRFVPQCEENPKYKIEMCEAKTDEIDNLIYDAWGMHVSNNMCISWEEFSGIIYKGRELTETQKKFRKLNKTFEEWVEVLTDPNYRYSSLYGDRMNVADHLLCCIGTGYEYQGGYIVKTASGADQDEALYGEWENAVFKEDIQKVIDEIMSNPLTEQTITGHFDYTEKYRKEEAAKNLERDMQIFGMPYEEYIKSGKGKKIWEEVFGCSEEEPKYKKHYPIGKYAPILELDEKAHPSYLKVGIEICEEILLNHKLETPENVEWAKKLIPKFKNLLEI